MSKGASREVWDFLMSIDYGLCHGPVDSINQVWVKDKPIWCGWEQTRTDKAVDQPDLFGGADGEGGCVGTVEFYPGDDTQVSSDELASRVGRTSATMPGYRGLAHLFFRGKTGGGFRWTSNNPYLPSMKASVTRIPTSLSPVNAQIMPPIGVAEDGSFIPAEIEVGGNPIDYDLVAGPLASAAEKDAVFRIASSVISWTSSVLPHNDLYGFGLTQVQIDAAAGSPDFTARASFTGTPQELGGGPTTAQFFVDIGFFPDDGTGNPDFATYPNGLTSPDGAPAQHGYVNGGPGEFTVSANCRIPAGTRFVLFRGHITLALPFTETVVDITRSHGLTYPEFVIAHCQADGTLGTLPDANPAHIIHECLVNPEWGRGENPAMIDVTSFNAAAQTFYDEFMGLSFGWYRQSDIESFIQEVLDHVQAMLFQDPETGLWNLKPLRADYTTVGIPVLDPSNCKVINPKRRLWGETINEIVVSYTDPNTEQPLTVNSHNLGNIAIQGGVISETREYYGFRNEWIAQHVADRDVAASGYPLFSCQVETDRQFWKTKPGDVLEFNWPEENIASMIVRVMDVDRGSSTDRKMVISVTEDVFAVEQTTYSSPQGSLWTTDRIDAADMPYKLAATMTMPSLIRSGADAADIDARYPEVGVMLMADQLPRPMDIEAHTLVTKTNGASVVESVKTFPVARSTALTANLVPEVASVIPGSLVTDILSGAEEQGDLLMLGAAEMPAEIVMLDSYNSITDEWTVARGIWDTVPVDWSIGDRLWVLPDSGMRADPTIRSAGENLTYWFLPRTTEGRLPIAQATPVNLIVSERPHLPFRPANCELDATGFLGVDYSFATTGAPPPATITATWENRNRLTEDSVAMRWDGGTVTPEAGQTTVLRVIDSTGTFSHEITGLAGTSYAIPIASFDPVYSGWVEFVSERTGLRSLTGVRIPFDISQSGYGQFYGQSYGP